MVASRYNITCYLKAAALLLDFLERRKVNNLPAYYSILIVFTLVCLRICHHSAAYHNITSSAAYHLLYMSCNTTLPLVVQCYLYLVALPASTSACQLQQLSLASLTSQFQFQFQFCQLHYLVLLLLPIIDIRMQMQMEVNFINKNYIE